MDVNQLADDLEPSPLIFTLFLEYHSVNDPVHERIIHFCLYFVILGSSLIGMCIATGAMYTVMV